MSWAVRELWREDSKEDLWSWVRVLGEEEKGLLRGGSKVRVLLNIQRSRSRLRLFVSEWDSKEGFWS